MVRSVVARGRGAFRLTLDSGVWRPSNARYVVTHGSARTGPGTPLDAAAHLRAASGWLVRAQDATGDGGFSHAYALRRGWGPSYPETTGYIVTTLLSLAARTGDAGYRARAERAIGFLVGTQLDGGAFPSGTTGAAERYPSIFNTGQIIGGLGAWYASSGDENARRAACAAADWLVGVQDDDGAWRRHGYLGYPVTYTAHASCWLAELGTLIDEPRYLEAARRHVDWVLRQQDPETGWFHRSGFGEQDHASRQAITHTIAYTIWGVLHAGALLGRDDAVEASRRAASAVAGRVGADGRLPGMLDRDWRARSSWECVTGSAQMAIVWMRLCATQADAAMAGAAVACLARVCAAQSLDDPNPGIRGGVPGSNPVAGGYFPFAFPNWAAKFLADALLLHTAGVARQAPPGPSPAPPG